MSSYPVSILHFCSNYSVVVSGPHYRIFDNNSGSLQASTATFQSPALDNLLKSGPIRCSQVDPSETYLVTAGDDKILKVWRLQDLELLSSRESPKKPTCIVFTSDGQSILVADKFGDVFRYPLQPDAETAAERTKKDALSSHDNPSGGDLILGHVSLLTSILLSPDERYIISADRDEHIRVSWYPQAYTIESFCLGHTKFVSSIHIPKFDTTRLVSGGGDTSIKVWDWMRGRQLCEIPAWDTIEPFIAVKPQKRRHSEVGDGDDSGATTKKKAKRRAKGKEQERPDEDMEMYTDDRTSTPLGGEATAPSPLDELKKYLVIQKIDSVEIKSKRYLIFSAVGATAIFACLFPDAGSGASIFYIDLGCPVLSFSVGSNGQIWATLDPGWARSDDTRHVKVIQITDGDELEELVEHAYPNLARALNSSENQIAANAEDLAALDVYHALSSMPKHPDAEHDAMDREAELERRGKNVSKKELGRLKRKEELALIGSVTPEGEGAEKSKRQKSQ